MKANEERARALGLQTQPLNVLHLPQDGNLQVRLQVAVVKPEEIQHLRILKQYIRRHALYLPQLRQVVPHGLLRFS